MGPEQARLIDRLCNDPNRKLVNFDIFPGEQKCTAEELCAEINRALDQVENGTAIPGPPFCSQQEPIDVRELVRKFT